MALPLTGLVLFFEMTQPSKVMNAGFPATQMAIAESLVVGSKPWERHASVARFDGVSAEQNSANVEPVSQVVTVSDARHLLEQASFASLKVGSRVEFLTRDRHRIAIQIVSREPVIDRALADNSLLMAITEASTANIMTFAWGNWIYKARIEDKGAEPDVVVQKVL